MLLSGDSAEAAASIIEKEGVAALKGDVADAIAGDYKDLKSPRDVMVKSWQDDPTAGGAWVS